MSVLILSAYQDVHAQAVMSALASFGTHAELVDLSEFPTALSLSMEFANGRRHFSLRRRSGGYIDFDAIDAVWWRRPQPFRLPSSMGRAEQQFAFSEASTAFQGLYHALRAFWINDPSLDAVAAHKPYQLAVAQAVGLRVPNTLMTNDIAQARSFWRRYEGRVVYKQFLALPETWRETRHLADADEVHAATIAYAPVIFQEAIDAIADIRITMIDGKIFAAATDVRDCEYPWDVRMNLNSKYKPHEVSSDVLAALRDVMSHLGLVFGAIDLRLTPDGQYVFLEVNPAGQFLYIENDTGQEISAAVAQALSVKRTPYKQELAPRAPDSS